MLASRVSVIAPPVDPRWFDSADQAVKTGVMQQFDVRSPATQRWLNIRVSRVSDDLFQQTFVDVTDRHRLDEQRTEMLKEMSHRVMNNFQMMASFLHIQASGAPPSVKAQLRTAESRVQVLAELHSLLAYTESAQEIDAAAYISQLCRRLGAVIDRPEEITIACVCEPLMLATDKIVPLGFVISELVTNAAKYAFPPPAQGVISVTLTRTLDCWTLTIRDNGRGLVGAVETPGSEPPVGGLGTRLVRRFVQRIGGEIVTVCDGGLRHDIRFHPES
jgi:two-component sensor histidine kinase